MLKILRKLRLLTELADLLNLKVNPEEYHTLRGEFVSKEIRERNLNYQIEFTAWGVRIVDYNGNEAPQWLRDQYERDLIEAYKNQTLHPAYKAKVKELFLALFPKIHVDVYKYFKPNNIDTLQSESLEMLFTKFFLAYPQMGTYQGFELCVNYAEAICQQLGFSCFVKENNNV